MTGADKVVCHAATLLLLFTLTSVPAKAQFGGGGGSQDMMTQMAPMLEMMKAKMGKRRFAMMMQTMGPMMSRMMEGGGGSLGSGLGGGLGGMMGGGGIPGGIGGGYVPEGYGVSTGGWWLSTHSATAQDFFKLAAASMVLLGVLSCVSVMLTRWGPKPRRVAAVQPALS